jgi:hypothetical protein
VSCACTGSRRCRADASSAATDAWLKLLFDPVAAVERVDFTRGEGPASAVITFRTPEEAQCAVQFDGYVALGNAL